MSNYTLTASVRNDLGKGASRRLRRENLQVPAIVYGGNQAPQPIAVEKSAFYKAIEDEAFFSSVIDLVVDGKSEQVVVRDLQRHPYKPLVTHADFMRVEATQAITINVPLHVVGAEKSKGIKDQGGELHLLASEVQISCLPKDLPDFLEVDVTAVEVGTILHLSDLKLPAGVSLVELALGADHDHAVVSITKPKGAATEGEDEGQEGGNEE